LTIRNILHQRAKPLAVAAMALSLTALAQPAQACSCICDEPTHEQFLDAYDAVFEGVAVRSVEVRDGDGFWSRLQFWRQPDPVAGYRETTFRVERAWIGDRVDEFAVRTSTEGSLCGVDFELNQSYFIAASERGDGALHTGLCTQVCVTRENSLPFLDAD